MKAIKIIRLAVPAMVAVWALASCRGPKTIPDRELRGIFKEVFIANAYTQSERALEPSRDSLDIYRPILRRYDYTMSDFEYTLANFSKRKSVRLSNVVEEAIRELEAEESYYRQKASLLDSIDVRAQRVWARDIIRDSTVRVRTVRDTSRLTFVVPVSEGIYDVGYFYELDSTDQNRGLRTTFVISNAAGSPTHTNNNWMNARRRTRVDMKFTPKEGDSLLTIRFANYPETMTTPGLTIDSLTITYRPEIRVALDSMDRVVFPYKRVLDRWQ